MLLILILIQGVRYLLLNAPPEPPEFVLREDPEAVSWMQALQLSAKSEVNLYTYDPNTLTDYQSYLLAITPEEIDRLFAYRAKGHRIQNPSEFLAVTQIHEDRWVFIAPRIRFPKAKTSASALRQEHIPEVGAGMKDINKVSAYTLREIPGIGPVLSERIVKFRNRLGGFQVMDQVYDVYGLEPEVARRVIERYIVFEKPQIQPININQATVEEIASLVYLRWDVARKIIAYRERHGPFESLKELTKIEDFPSDKIARISLYLSL